MSTSDYDEETKSLSATTTIKTATAVAVAAAAAAAADNNNNNNIDNDNDSDSDNDNNSNSNNINEYKRATTGSKSSERNSSIEVNRRAISRGASNELAKAAAALAAAAAAAGGFNSNSSIVPVDDLPDKRPVSADRGGGCGETGDRTILQASRVLSASVGGDEEKVTASATVGKAHGTGNYSQKRLLRPPLPSLKTNRLNMPTSEATAAAASTRTTSVALSSSSAAPAAPEVAMASSTLDTSGSDTRSWESLEAPRYRRGSEEHIDCPISY